MTRKYKVNKRSYFVIKRLFDIISSFLMIVLLSWLLILLSLIVLFTSGYPLVYKEKRVGLNGKDVYIYKYRTMVKNADQKIKELLTQEQYETWLVEHKLKDDPRITKFGKVLRKSSMDELPQLFNILFGSMSVVGPRPVTRDEINKYFTDEQKNVLLCVRPGLISYWSLHGRSNIHYQNGKRQELELEYFYHYSVIYDIGMVFKSIPVVLSGKGAK